MNVYGYIGGGLIASTLVPQIAHTCRVKKADQISIGFLSTNILGTTFMVIYSIQEYLLPVIITNIVILLSLMVLCVLKFRYRDKTNDNIFSNTNV